MDLASLKRKLNNKKVLITSSSAAVLICTALQITKQQQYSSTVNLGREKHVNQLLALSERPETAADNILQIAAFRRSNWRFYLSESSLEELNKKGIALHRSLWVESLRNTIRRQAIAAFPISELDSAYSRLTGYRDLPAFKWLDPQTKELLQGKINNLSSQLVAKRKAEEARQAKEQAEALEKQRREEEAQRAAAEYERAQYNNYEADSSQSGYIIGPRGGCYYLTGNSKVYVDRSYCQ